MSFTLEVSSVDVDVSFEQDSISLIICSAILMKELEYSTIYLIYSLFFDLNYYGRFKTTQHQIRLAC